MQRDFKSKLSIFSFAFMAALSFLVLPGYAVDKASVQSKLTDVEVQLDKIEEGQKNILAGQEEIFERLKQLKIWVRRN